MYLWNSFITGEIILISLIQFFLLPFHSLFCSPPQSPIPTTSMLLQPNQTNIVFVLIHRPYSDVKKTLHRNCCGWEHRHQKIINIKFRMAASQGYIHSKWRNLAQHTSLLWLNSTRSNQYLLPIMANGDGIIPNCIMYAFYLNVIYLLFSHFLNIYHVYHLLFTKVSYIY
jgi:hypothetical protein